ncbi:hypothetical protein BT93_F1920 [Corymbia citriodora subsp. variegata]|nr:hypothetical protein BT93_F1920 [Corymbia citriodora subsp. variegata]
MPNLVQLMASFSATDVENTILLLMRCRQFQIDGSEACLRKMLPLVFSPDKSIYEAVENAFITIYIRKNPVETAKNLVSLAVDSNIGQANGSSCREAMPQVWWSDKWVPKNLLFVCKFME